VVEILDDTRVLGTCLNAKKLGQRKNCNLPGVLVDLPVLGPQDVQDVAGFAAKHGMDFVAASFVQSADDVRCVGCGVLRLWATSATHSPMACPTTTHTQVHPASAARGRCAAHQNYFQD
jgi:hypothetical protein